MRFVLINSATSASPLFAAMTPQALATIASALVVQLNRDVAPYWGGTHSGRVGASVADVQTGEFAMTLVDSLVSVAPGAVAFHDVDGNEVPYGTLGLDQCNALQTGSDSVSSATSHELVEATVDAYCNAWRQNATQQQAQEACDPVQEWGYVIGGVAVSDFVLPAYWAPGSAGPWNFGALVGGQAVAGPFAIAPGGYAIVQTAGTGETQVTGKIGDHRLAKKRHPSSRTYRRGVRL